MSFYKISKTLLSNSRSISFSPTTRFIQTAHFKSSLQRRRRHIRYMHDPVDLSVSFAYAEANSTLPTRFQNVVDRTLKEYDSNDSIMLVSPIQGSLFTLLCKTFKVKKVLELGTFTGYSALCFAEGVKGNGPDVKVVTCERDTKNANNALQNIKEAGMDDIIEIKVGDGLETIRKFDKGTAFDLIFIDANKPGYINYYETILERDLLSENGLILADNVLFSGYVQRVPNYDPKATSESKNYIPEEIYGRIVKPLYDFNEHVNKDPRTSNVLLPAFDGLMLIRKN